MSQNKNNIAIKEIVWNDLQGKKFRIPLYQRRYAWESEQVEQLIKDVAQANNEYFVGNLVVEKKGDFLEVIDGQQRLTTLYLISIVKKELWFELHYEVREADDAFLKDLQEVGVKNLELIWKEGIDPVFKENLDTIKIALGENNNFKLENIKFTITYLHSDEVDVTKYFEVMNSRGKQLEQHEVVKAKLLEKIDNRDLYAKVWDYCSQMDAYVEDFIYRYEKRVYDREKKKNVQEMSAEELRKELLDFAFLQCNEIDNFFKKSENKNDNNCTDGRLTLEEILKNDHKNEIEKEKEAVDRYQSFMKFEYFLLHVLQLYFDEKIKGIQVELNDLKLYEQFKNYENEIDSTEFIETLFRYRLLYDYFFVKRWENDKPFFTQLIFEENEVKIDRGKKDENNLREKTIESLKNIQLLFNFTTDFFTQDWIYTTLKWLKKRLSEEKEVSKSFYNKFLEFLENLDKKVAFERLGNGDLKNIFQNFDGDEKIESNIDKKKELMQQLNRGTATPHYWFYKLEYLLWKNDCLNKQNYSYKFEEKERFSYKTIWQNYRLSRLNSIEHMKPQSKAEDWEKENWKEKCKECDADRAVDCFGNLALISRHLNSALLNDENNKKDIIQKQLNRGTIESLKMIDFYSRIQGSEDMTIDNCQEHHKNMVNILIDSFK